MNGPVVEDGRPPLGKILGFVAFFLAISWGLSSLAGFPWMASDPGSAMLKVSFKYTPPFKVEQAGLTEAEIRKLPVHMRPTNPARAVTGERKDTVLELELDGRPLLKRVYRPVGLRRDGPSYAYEEIPLPPGTHTLRARLGDREPSAPVKGQEEGGDRRGWSIQKKATVAPGQVLLLEFQEEAGFTLR